MTRHGKIEVRQTHDEENMIEFISELPLWVKIVAAIVILIILAILEHIYPGDDDNSPYG